MSVMDEALNCLRLLCWELKLVQWEGEIEETNIPSVEFFQDLGCGMIYRNGDEWEYHVPDEVTATEIVEKYNAEILNSEESE